MYLEVGGGGVPSMETERSWLTGAAASQTIILSVKNTGDCAKGPDSLRACACKDAECIRYEAWT